MGFLSRRKQPAHPTGLPSSVPKPTPVIYIHNHYEGILWTIPPSSWPRDKMLPCHPPISEGPNAITHKWEAHLRQGVLTLTPFNSWDKKGKVDIPLMGLEVEVVREKLKPGEIKSPWAKRLPIELRSRVRSKEIVRPYNESSLLIFAESAAAKEQWATALSAFSSSASHPSLIARDMFSSFCMSMSNAMGTLVSPPPPPLQAPLLPSEKQSASSISPAQGGGRKFAWLARLIPGRRGKNIPPEASKSQSVKEEKVVLRIIVNESGCSLKSLLLVHKEGNEGDKESKLRSSTSLLAEDDLATADLPPLNPNASPASKKDDDDDAEDFSAAAQEDGFALPGLFGLNRFMMRFGYELLVSKKLDRWLARWLTKRLDDFNDGPRPEFLGRLELVSMDLGNVLPLIKDIKAVAGSLNSAAAGAAFPQIAAEIQFKGELTLSFSTTIDPQKASFVKSLAETLRGIAGQGGTSQSQDGSGNNLDGPSPSPSSRRTTEDTLLVDPTTSESKGRRNSGGGGSFIGGLIGKLASNVLGITESLPVIPVTVEVKITQFDGELLAWIAPPPSDRLWISFSSPPTVSLSTRPILSGRVFKYTALLHQVSSIIKKIIMKAINRQLVFPSCADIRIPFLASHLQAAEQKAAENESQSQSQSQQNPSHDDPPPSLSPPIDSSAAPSSTEKDKEVQERKPWFTRRNSPSTSTTVLTPPPGLKSSSLPPKPPKVPSSQSLASPTETSPPVSAEKKPVQKKGFTFRLRLWGGGKREKQQSSSPSPESSSRHLPGLESDAGPPTDSHH